MTASQRLQIAKALIRRADGNSLPDIRTIAYTLISECPPHDVLKMPEVQRWPEIRIWLGREIGQATGVLAPREVA